MEYICVLFNFILFHRHERKIMRVWVVFSMCLFIDWCGAAVDLFKNKNHLQINNVPDLRKESSRSFKNSGFINDVKSLVPIEREQTERQGRMCKKKKKKKMKHLKHMKYMFPLFMGWLLIKALLLPVVLKGLALLSGKAVILSLMSLVLAAILAFRRIVSIIGLSNPAGANIAAYNRKGILYDDEEQLPPAEEAGADPYNYYRRIDHRH